MRFNHTLQATSLGHNIELTIDRLEGISEIALTVDEFFIKNDNISLTPSQSVKFIYIILKLFKELRKSCKGELVFIDVSGGSKSYYSIVKRLGFKPTSHLTSDKFGVTHWIIL